MAKTKYAVPGEFVKIGTPKQFVRCGYPLSIKDVMNEEFEEIESACQRMFAALENRPAPNPPKPSLCEWELVLVKNKAPIMSATVHGMICAAIAAHRLEQRNFGGNVRLIIENDEYAPFAVGELWVVTKKQFVKTGKVSLVVIYDDYEPGGLEGERTHCIYTVKRNGRSAKILAAHCERLTDAHVQVAQIA